MTLDTANVKITGLVSKRKSTRTRKGACWLKTVLVQAAWAAVRTKNSYYRAQFLRLRARRGPKKAIVAVAASMLTVIYYILRDSAEYRELGGQYFERLDRTKATQRLVKRLRDLGYRVQMDSIVRIFLGIGRGERIRTSGPSVPNRVDPRGFPSDFASFRTRVATRKYQRPAFAGHRRHGEHQTRRRNAQPACCATLHGATVIAMTLKARVKAGRLVVDEPTDLPEGTEIELLPLDPGDWLDEEDRAALHKALRDSEEDVKAGRLVDADTVLRELRSR